MKTIFMKTIFFLVVITAVRSLEASAASGSSNLVVNGSFEAGAGGWSFTGGLTIGGPPDLPHPIGVDGTHVASMGGGDIPNSTLSQSFLVSADTAYVLTLATAAFGDNYPGRVGSVRVDLIAPDGSVLASQSFTDVSPAPSVGTNGFTRHTIPFRIASLSAVTLRITDTSPGGGVAVDSLIDDLRVYRHTSEDGENLLVNGSFETPAILNGTAQLPADTLAPWQTTDDSVELWLSADNVPSVNGAQNLEILSRSATATIWQAVSTIPGEGYTLRFYHSPRPSVNSALSVAINGRTLATFTENGASLTGFNWQRFRTNFTASSNLTTIAFTDTSAGASGTHIDNVVLERMPVSSTIRVSEVEICWETVVTKVYQVQYRSALTASSWTNWGEPAQGNGATMCIKDAVPTGEPQRFYRVMTP